MKIIISENEANQRFDRYLRKYYKQYPSITLKEIYSMIRKKDITLNGKKAKENQRIQIGDIIELRKENPAKTKEEKQENYRKKQYLRYPQEEIILYQDKHRMVFNKPPHIAMHPWTKQEERLTLHELLVHFTQEQKEQKQQKTKKGKEWMEETSETFKPNFCYRLDKDTSGIVIAALSYPALQLLNRLIRERETSKKYHCIVVGKTPFKGEINEPLFKGFNKKLGKAQSFINHEKGLEAHTSYKRIKSIKNQILWTDISLLEVEIKTGRMHQIRAHLAHINYPILGDIHYGIAPINRILHKKTKINRQLLHASAYTFFDTIQKKEISIRCPLPQDFNQLFSS